MTGVHIGNCAMIDAISVFGNDFPVHEIVVGNPARETLKCFDHEWFQFLQNHIISARMLEAVKNTDSFFAINYITNWLLVICHDILVIRRDLCLYMCAKEVRNMNLGLLYADTVSNDLSFDSEYPAVTRETVEEMRNYAAEQGYSIIAEFIDDIEEKAYDNSTEKPALKRLMDSIEDYNCGIVLVFDYHQLGRTNSEINYIRYYMKRFDVDIVCLKTNDEYTIAKYWVMFDALMNSIVKDHYNLLEKCIDNRKFEKAKQHKHISGKVPLGYKLNDDSEYAVDLENAALVNSIFEMLTGPDSIEQISMYLTYNSIRDNMGNKITSDALRKMLEDERYIGVYTYKKLIRDENALPAIVDKSLYYDAVSNHYIDKKLHIDKWDYDGFLLSGRLFCGQCGDAMTSESVHNLDGKTSYRYFCRNSHQCGVCRKESIRRIWLEGYVLERIEVLLSDDSVTKHLTEIIWNIYSNLIIDKKVFRVYESRIEQINRSVENLVRTIENGYYCDSIAERITELEKEKKRLKSSVSLIIDYFEHKYDRKSFDFFITDLKRSDISDRNKQKLLINILVDSVYISDDDIAIIYNFSGGESIDFNNDIKDKGIMEYVQLFDSYLHNLRFS